MSVKTDFKFWHGCFVTLQDGTVVPEDVAIKVLSNKYSVEMNGGK